jgi:hypothetical protein
MQGMHPTLVIYDEVADFGRSMQAFAAAMNPVIRQWAEGFRKISAVMSPLAHAFAGPYDRKHRARCRYCTPDANQGPLCIDGHEYRRRQRARRRRR